jgi:cardiolipin synthase
MRIDWTEVTAIVYLVSWLIFIAALFVVPVDRRPSSATAWLLLIFLLPFLGLLIFLLLGNPKLSAKRRAQQQTMDEIVARQVVVAQQQPGLAQIYNPPVPERYQAFASLNTALGGLPPLAANRVELLSDYHGAIASITEAIEQATKYVHLEYFALSRDEETEPLFAAMERAQARSIPVRVLMDDIGSRIYPNFKPMLEQLRAAGIAHYRMLPVDLFHREFSRLDLRNHRKVVVVDGQVAFCGSQNMIRQNYFRKDELYYDELVARVEGPAVAAFNAVFVTDWYAESGVVLSAQTAPEIAGLPGPAGDVLAQVLPSGPGHEHENNLKLFASLLYAARRKLVISTPYFVPDESLTIALSSAAQRGVDVMLLNSEAPDQFLVFHAQRSFYAALLRAGVKIALYRKPILLHSKFLTVDDDIAVIGSSNMDMRSFELSLEVTLVCYDRGVVAECRKVEAYYLEHARTINLPEWEARSTATKLVENLARLTSALQ